MDKSAVTHSGIPSPDIKQLLIIPLGNVTNDSKKNPTVSSGTYLKTETSNMPQLKTHPNLQSQYKESTPSSIGVKSSFISTYVEYTTAMGPKPRKE